MESKLRRPRKKLRYFTSQESVSTGLQDQHRSLIDLDKWFDDLDSSPGGEGDSPSLSPVPAAGGSDDAEVDFSPVLFDKTPAHNRMAETPINPSFQTQTHPPAKEPKLTQTQNQNHPPAKEPRPTQTQTHPPAKEPRPSQTQNHPPAKEPRPTQTQNQNHPPAKEPRPSQTQNHPPAKEPRPTQTQNQNHPPAKKPRPTQTQTQNQNPPPAKEPKLTQNQTQTHPPAKEPKPSQTQNQNPPPVKEPRPSQTQNQNPPPAKEPRPSQTQNQNPPPVKEPRPSQTQNQNPPPAKEPKPSQTQNQNPRPAKEPRPSQPQNHPPVQEPRPSQTQNQNPPPAKEPRPSQTQNQNPPPAKEPRPSQTQNQNPPPAKEPRPSQTQNPPPAKEPKPSQTQNQNPPPAKEPRPSQTQNPPPAKEPKPSQTQNHPPAKEPGVGPTQTQNQNPPPAKEPEVGPSQTQTHPPAKEPRPTQTQTQNHPPAKEPRPSQIQNHPPVKEPGVRPTQTQTQTQNHPPLDEPRPSQTQNQNHPPAKEPGVGPTQTQTQNHPPAKEPRPSQIQNHPPVKEPGVRPTQTQTQTQNHPPLDEPRPSQTQNQNHPPAKEPGVGPTQTQIKNRPPPEEPRPSQTQNHPPLDEPGPCQTQTHPLPEEPTPSQTMSTFWLKLRESRQFKPACLRKVSSPVKEPAPPPELDDDEFKILEDDCPRWFIIPKRTNPNQNKARAKQDKAQASSSNQEVSANMAPQGDQPEKAPLKQAPHGGASHIPVLSTSTARKDAATERRKKNSSFRRETRVDAEADRRPGQEKPKRGKGRPPKGRGRELELPDTAESPGPVEALEEEREEPGQEKPKRGKSRPAKGRGRELELPDTAESPGPVEALEEEREEPGQEKDEDAPGLLSPSEKFTEDMEADIGPTLKKSKQTNRKGSKPAFYSSVEEEQEGCRGEKHTVLSSKQPSDLRPRQNRKRKLENPLQSEEDGEVSTVDQSQGELSPPPSPLRQNTSTPDGSMSKDHVKTPVEPFLPGKRQRKVLGNWWESKSSVDVETATSPPRKPEPQKGKRGKTKGTQPKAKGTKSSQGKPVQTEEDAEVTHLPLGVSPTRTLLQLRSPDGPRPRTKTLEKPKRGKSRPPKGRGRELELPDTAESPGPVEDLEEPGQEKDEDAPGLLSPSEKFTEDMEADIGPTLKKSKQTNRKGSKPAFYSCVEEEQEGCRGEKHTVLSSKQPSDLRPRQNRKRKLENPLQSEEDGEVSTVDQSQGELSPPPSPLRQNTSTPDGSMSKDHVKTPVEPFLPGKRQRKVPGNWWESKSSVDVETATSPPRKPEPQKGKRGERLFHRTYSHTPKGKSRGRLDPFTPRGPKGHVKTPVKHQRKAPGNWWAPNVSPVDVETATSPPGKPQHKKGKTVKTKGRRPKPHQPPSLGPLQNGGATRTPKPRGGSLEPLDLSDARLFRKRGQPFPSQEQGSAQISLASEGPHDEDGDLGQEPARGPIVFDERTSAVERSATSQMLSRSINNSRLSGNALKGSISGSPSMIEQEQKQLGGFCSGPSSMIENEDVCLPSSRLLLPTLCVSDLCGPPLRPLLLQEEDRANLEEWLGMLWPTNIRNGSQVTPDQFQWYSYRGRAIGFHMDLQADTFCNGKILLGSFMKKPLWVDHNATSVYNLLTSCVSVTFNGKESHYNPGQAFVIPCGHAYSIRNLAQEPAVLYFNRMLAESPD